MIKVGAATETELKEKKHRVEDALSATRAAVEEGIVPGGGVALINAIPALDGVQAEGDDGRPACRSCAARWKSRCASIAANAGQDGAVVVETVRRMAEGAEQHQHRLRRADRRVRRHGGRRASSTRPR